MNQLFRIIFTGLAIVFFINNSVQAQDLIYSQYYAAPLQLNPAFAGNTLAPSIHLNYRSQWSPVDGISYESYSASYSQFFEATNSGFGFLATSDNQGGGFIKSTHLTCFFAYKLQINRDFALKFGIEAGVIQHTYDWSRYTFGDQIDEIEGPIAPDGTPYTSEEVAPLDLSKKVFDVSTGILAYSKRFYGGVTLKHINTPDDSILEINQNLNAGYPMRASIHGGMQIPIGANTRRGPEAFISPNVLYTFQRDFAQLNIGAYASVGPVFAGAWFRQAYTNPDALIFLAGVQKGVAKIGYSYDMTVSSALNSRTNGSHELSVILNFDTNRKRQFDYNDCFDMFR